MTDDERRRFEEEDRTPDPYGLRVKIERLPDIPLLTWGDCIGVGHYSRVYSGVYQGCHSVAVKVIERGPDALVAAEVSVLQALRGVPHVIHLCEATKVGCNVLIFEHFAGIGEDGFFSDATLTRFRFVLRSVVEVLRDAHARLVVHRDMTLLNVMVNPEWSDCRIIDWGLACEVAADMNPKVGMRTIRSPEMLMNWGGYRTGGDVWAIGALIYYVLCGGALPWRASSSWATVVGIASFLDKTEIVALARKVGTTIPTEVVAQIHSAPARKFRECFAEETKHLADRVLIDLMKKSMTIDFERRPTAEQLLAHPFFRKK
jgi:serine/threonine protein kinase